MITISNISTKTFALFNIQNSNGIYIRNKPCTETELFGLSLGLPRSRSQSRPASVSVAVSVSLGRGPSRSRLASVSVLSQYRSQSRARARSCLRSRRDYLCVCLVFALHTMNTFVHFSTHLTKKFIPLILWAFKEN